MLEEKAFTWAHGLIGEQDPNADGVRTRGDVVYETCQGRRDPKRRGVRIRGHQRALSRSEAEIPGEDVSLFAAVLEEEAMSDMIVGDVIFDIDVMTAVNRDAATERVVNGIRGHSRSFQNAAGRRIKGHMEVDRVAAQNGRLSHMVEFGPFDIVSFEAGQSLIKSKEIDFASREG